MFDEPCGIGGALAFARHGTVAVNVERPPVQKFLVTIVFLVHELLWPESTPRYLAISTTALNGECLQRSDFQWLLERTPVARLGYSIYVYDITGDRSAHQALVDLYARNNWASHRDAEALLAR